jgi:hypothetical protein
MGKFKRLIGTVLIVIILFVTGLVSWHVGPKMGAQFTSSPDAQTSSAGAYGGLTVFKDDEEAKPEGDIAKIIVRAPEVAEIGELVRFDVSASQAESFKWLLVPESADFEVYNDGQQAIFSARKTGEYMFIVACAYKGTVDVATHVVTVGTPVPKPGDYPVVEKPDTKAPIKEWVPYWCSLTVRPEEETRRLAESFEGVAATIAAGVHTTPEEIVKATGDANQQALGDSVDAWKPFLLSLQNEFKKRAKAGTLVSPEQHAEMWREIAAGLRVYADLFETRTILK